MADIRSAFAADGPPMIVAHRGDWRAAPENSCAAIAAASGYAMVEIDVRLSSDGVPVVIHDADLLRTTGVSGRVSDRRVDDLVSLRLEGTDERLPTLADALAAGGPDLLFDIDVKDAAQLDPVAEFLSARPERARLMLKADVSDRSDIDWLRIREATSGVTVIAKAALRTSADVALIADMRDASVAAAEVWFSDLAVLRQAVETGLPLSTYTLPDVHCAGLNDASALIDPDKVWGALMDIGIRAIMTDQPHAAQFYLNARTGNRNAHR